MPKLAVLILSVLLLTPLTAVADASELSTESPDVENPYAATYVSRMQAPPNRQVTAKVYRGKDKVADYQRLLEEGYDLLGYSSFEGGDVPPELLMQQAQRVNADVVLVYTKGVQRPQATGVRYEYFSSYWTKLPPPLLGLHVQRDKNADEGAGGLEVLAVINDSPAARAGLRQGDILLRLGDATLLNPEQLSSTAQRYAGQVVEVVWTRDGETMRKTLTPGSQP